MNKFLSPDAKEFTFYSISHISVLIFILIFSILIFIFRKQINNNSFKKTVTIIIPLLVIVFFIINFIWLFLQNVFDYKYNLPLHLCDINYLLVIFLFLYRKQFIFEIIYLLGIGSSLQALLTPAVLYDFPHIIFFYFFFYHAIVIFSAVYFVFVEKFKVDFFSVIKSFIFLNITGIIVLIIDIILKSNYMFLLNKPPAGSLMDIMGPWPVYLIVAAVLAFINCLIFYLPFFIRDRFFNKTKSS